MCDAVLSYQSSKEQLKQYVPLSITMAHGSPNRGKIFSLRNLTTTLLSLAM